MTEPAGSDELLLRIGHAIELSGHGDRDGARTTLDEIWQEIGPEGDPFHRCAVCHHLADLQDDPEDELAWDLRALAAADEITDDRAAAGGMSGPVTTLYPSLHLNLGEVHRKLGNLDAAREHLRAGRVAAADLDSDGYGAMIKRGLEGLGERLDQS